MVLSNVDIHSALNSGHIGIDPFNAAYLNPASYTLTLGKRLLIPRANETPVDPSAPELSYDEVVIRDKFVVPCGAFLLGSVAESITLSTHYAAQLDARTTLARLGLNVLQGSTHIEPGQSGSHETLEITNIGPRPVILQPGMKIAKIVFMRLATPSSHGYAGRYAGQHDGRIPPGGS